jgi:hypothetical protein
MITDFFSLRKIQLQIEGRAGCDGKDRPSRCISVRFSQFAGWQKLQQGIFCIWKQNLHSWARMCATIPKKHEEHTFAPRLFVFRPVSGIFEFDVQFFECAHHELQQDDQ